MLEDIFMTWSGLFLRTKYHTVKDYLTQHGTVIQLGLNKFFMNLKFEFLNIGSHSRLDTLNSFASQFLLFQKFT